MPFILPLQRKQVINDASKTAKKRGFEIARFCTKMSTQAILNMNQEFDSLMFNKNKDFETHSNTFVAAKNRREGEVFETDSFVTTVIFCLGNSCISYTIHLEDSAQTVKADQTRPNPNNSLCRSTYNSAPQPHSVQTFQTLRGRS